MLLECNALVALNGHAALMLGQVISFDWDKQYVSLVYIIKRLIVQEKQEFEISEFDINNGK